MLYFFTAVTLAYNFVCTLMAVFVADTTGNTTAAGFFAAIYAVLGIPGAWLLWCAPDPPPLSSHHFYVGRSNQTAALYRTEVSATLT